MGSHRQIEAEPSIEAQTLSEAESSVNGQPPNKAEPSIEVQTLSEAESSVNGQPPNEAEPPIEVQTLSEAESSVNGSRQIRQSLPSRRRCCQK